MILAVDQRAMIAITIINNSKSAGKGWKTVGKDKRKPCLNAEGRSEAFANAREGHD